VADIRILDSMPQFEQAVDVEIAVWGVDPRDCIPTTFMRANLAAGGVNLGAYHGDRMIGFCVGFPAVRDGRLILWSAIAGVLPEFQGQSIGAALKIFQFNWAREQGFAEVRWTYDPIQAGNAHFNLHILGAAANKYHVNFYGVMNDAINRGMETDRVEAAVSLAQPYAPPVRPTPDPDALVLVSSGDDGMPFSHDFREDATLHVALPLRLRALGAAQQQAWRSAVRDALQTSFAHGYRAVDVMRDSSTAHYILTR
jgi:predicted GNAT superfamily acetyltransferase